MKYHDDTIVAAASAVGGAISVIRLSGERSHEICDMAFRSHNGRKIVGQKGYTMLYGDIVDEAGIVLDDVVVAVFRSPHSYTGENSVEISCHGSRYIVSEIIRLLISYGARAADAGEFTTRAFLAGRMDLSQAEAVADMVASHDRATHALASTQMRGGYSDDLAELRSGLLRLASLLELELDFSEEDVTFADRDELSSIIKDILNRIEQLINSFSLGNAIKEGIPVAIVGSPNAGKSTLLNALLREDRAMVSDIAGTTRDVIEERISIDGVEFRFIDTAGIRQSDDTLEKMGIERTFRTLERAKIILYLFDISSDIISAEDIVAAVSSLSLLPDSQICVVLNKCDDNESVNIRKCTELTKELNRLSELPVVSISAKFGHNIDNLRDFLVSSVDVSRVFSGDTVVSNSRHYEALLRTRESLKHSVEGLEVGLSSDLLAQHVRESLHWLGTITGEITTDEILSQIFSKFCIGK